MQEPWYWRYNSPMSKSGVNSSSIFPYSSDCSTGVENYWEISSFIGNTNILTPVWHLMPSFLPFVIFRKHLISPMSYLTSWLVGGRNIVRVVRAIHWKSTVSSDVNESLEVRNNYYNQQSNVFKPSKDITWISTLLIETCVRHYSDGALGRTAICSFQKWAKIQIHVFFLQDNLNMHCFRVVILNIRYIKQLVVPIFPNKF